MHRDAVKTYKLLDENICLKMKGDDRYYSITRSDCYKFHHQCAMRYIVMVEFLGRSFHVTDGSQDQTRPFPTLRKNSSPNIALCDYQNFLKV